LSEHIETLQEIDIEYREIAEHAGIHFLPRTALNTHPLFIEALAELVVEALKAPSLKYCLRLHK